MGSGELCFDACVARIKKNGLIGLYCTAPRDTLIPSIEKEWIKTF